jgi:hypothetical protein
MKLITSRGSAVLAAALALLGAITVWQPAKADTPNVLQIAIPTNVPVNPVGSHLVITGRSSAAAVVPCAPGTPWPHIAVLVYDRGNGPAEITDVLVFRDQELPVGSQYLITSGASPCTAEWQVFTGTRL